MRVFAPVQSTSNCTRSVALTEPLNPSLLQLVAAAADLCRKPLRHAVLPVGDHPAGELASEEYSLRLEARNLDGVRCAEEDLELEIYPSGPDLNLTLAWAHDPERPLLWHGSHPVWMAASTGLRCERPQDGAPLESLARRLRAQLAPRTGQ